MKNYLTFFALLFLGHSILAQDNVFLDRDFWSTRPTVATVQLKIKQGHDIAQANASNFDGVSQAILADAPLETIKFALAQKGNDVNKITHDNRTYIFWAASKGNVPLMQFLLEQGAKANATDNKGSTVLNFAANSGQKDTQVYDLLLQHGANLQTDLTPAGANALLLIAPYDTDLTLIDYFVSKGVDVNAVDRNGNGIFNYVAKTGNIELMDRLLGKGYKGTDSAFIFASQGIRGKANSLEVYKYLEGIGLNPNAVSNEGITPLHTLASRSKDMAVINYFLDKGLDVNQADTHGNTPFINACDRNNLEVVRLFAKTVKDINQTNKKGESALALAVSNNGVDVVDFLLSQNADVKVKDANGNDLSVYLMQHYDVNNQEVFNQKLALLKDHGFVFGKPQSDGDTLYHLALDKNDLPTLEFIQQFHPDVNATNKDGITPLHKAAMSAKDADILHYLISVGAKKEAVTDFDETAYNLALENELLKKQNISVEFLK